MAPSRSVFSLLRAVIDLTPFTMRMGWWQLIPLSVVMALSEAIGALLIFGLLMILAVPDEQQLPRWMFDLRTWIPNLSEQSFIEMYAFCAVLFFVIKSGLRIVETRMRQRYAHTTAAAVSGDLLARYLNAPYEYLTGQNSAIWLRNLQESTGQLQAVLVASAAAISEVLVIVGVTLIVIVKTPLIALAAILVAGGSTLLVLRWMQQRFSDWGAERHVLGGKIRQSLLEIFAGIKEIKIAGASDFFVREFRLLRERLAAIDTHAETLRVVPQVTVETLFVASLVVASTVMLTVGAAPRGNALATIGFVGYALMRLLPTVHLLIFHINECRLGHAAIDSLAHDFNSLEAQKPTPDPECKRTISDAPVLNQSIRFERVSYRYGGSETHALDSISFGIERGECIGIVGANGAGKSTLVDLLLGLLMPTSGTITIDGINIQSILDAWRAQLGYVAQRSFFLDASIRQNISFGVEEANVSNQRLNAAVNGAQLEPVIAPLLAGLETRIGEGGGRLSGGEKQRLATARALYRNPDVLVFDEPTSALDGVTEKAWTAAIHALRGQKTVIIIAHRMATLRDCDRLLYLDKGKLVDIDRFDALYAKYVGFRALADTQAAPTTS